MILDLKMFIKYFMVISVITLIRTNGQSCYSTTGVYSKWTDNNFVGNANLWFEITVTSKITDGWTLTLRFSKPVWSIEIWDAEKYSVSADEMTWTFMNKYYNKDLDVGQILGMNFLVKFDGDTPMFTAELIGQPVCSGLTTATQTATTTPSAGPGSTTAPGQGGTTTTVGQEGSTTTPIGQEATTTPAGHEGTTTPAGQEGTTTPAEQGGTCITKPNSEWSGNADMFFSILVTSQITGGWTLVLKFSKPVLEITIWDAEKFNYSADKMTWTLKNKEYNKDLNVGGFLSMNFLAKFEGDTPTFTVQLSGHPECGGETVTAQPATTTLLTGQMTSPGQESTTTPTVQESTTPGGQESTTTPSGQGSTTTPPAGQGSTSSLITLPESAPFDYYDALNKSILFYEAQRSGYLPDDNRITYRGDSALDDGNDVGEDLTGGWYDAGDHVKFGHPMAGATTVLAWGLIEYRSGYVSAGHLDNMLDCIKWATDYFLKCHTAPYEFYGQVGNGNIDHSYWERPEEISHERPAYVLTPSKPGSDLLGETAAALAAASMAFNPTDPTYATTLLENARSLYIFAKQYEGKYSDSISDANNFYSSTSYYDELVWAAAWLYRATNEQEYLDEAEYYYWFYNLGYKPWAFDWDDKTAGLQLLMFELTGKPIYENAATAFLDGWESGNDVHYTPKGLAWRIQWSPNRYAANVAFLALVAADLGIKPTIYRDFATAQINYILGSTGRSYLVGFGQNPPDRPHHKSSSCPDLPAPCGWADFHADRPNPQILYGAVIGGPDSNDNFINDRGNFETNEVACDYNAGFQSSVAGIISFLTNSRR